MSRFFWLLLAASRSGYRYLRARLRSALGLSARADTAPGSEAEGRLTAGGDLLAAGVSRSVAPGRITVRRESTLAGRMVAWLVSVARFSGRTDTEAVLAIQASAAANLAGAMEADTVLVQGLEAAPGEPGAFRADATLDWAALPLPGSPEGMGAEYRPGSVLEAAAFPGAPSVGAGTVAALHGLSAGMEGGTPASGRGVFRHQGMLSAHIISWITNQWVGDTTLYIRQVYDTERDGDTLILK